MVAVAKWVVAGHTSRFEAAGTRVTVVGEVTGEKGTAAGR